MQNWILVSFIGDLRQDFEDVYKMAVQFFSYCYGCTPEVNEESIIAARVKVWFKKISSLTHASPPLKTLPPTDSSLRANVKRGHYQAAIWRSCNSQHHPHQSPEDFGWYCNESNLLLSKLFDTPTAPVIAPECLITMIRCQCKAANNRCTHGRCTCKDANMPFTPFCGCNYDDIRCGSFQPEENADPDQYNNIVNDDSDSDKE